MYTIHNEILIDTLVELRDVELVTVACSFRIFLYITKNVLHKVVHSPVFNACGGCSYKPLF